MLNNNNIIFFCNKLGLCSDCFSEKYFFIKNSVKNVSLRVRLFLFLQDLPKSGGDVIVGMEFYFQHLVFISFSSIIRDIQHLIERHSARSRQIIP